MGDPAPTRPARRKVQRPADSWWRRLCLAQLLALLLLAGSVASRTATPTNRRWVRPLPELDPRPVGRTFSHEEIIERLLQASGQDRLDPRVENGDTAYYNLFRRWAKRTGQSHGYTSRLQIARQLYAGIETQKDAQRKGTAMQNREVRLAAAGALRVTQLLGPHGEDRGIYWELRDDPVDPDAYHRGAKSGLPTARLAPVPAGVAQSVRAAES